MQHVVHKSAHYNNPPTHPSTHTGVDAAGLHTKQTVVTNALQHHKFTPTSIPPAEAALAAVGGLELAAMVGAYMQAYDMGIAAIVDGFVSGVAALVAVRMQPDVHQVLFGSHTSAEKGTRVLLEALELVAPLDGGLRLGEGTGAVLAVGLLRAATALLCDVATLEDVIGSGK